MLLSFYMRKILSVIIVIVFLLFFAGNLWATTIYIRNQTDFDNLSLSINSAIGKGEKSIKVDVLTGTYEFKERHILLKDINAPSVSIRIRGRGEVVIIPAGKTYGNGDIYEGPFNIDNSWTSNFQDVNIWSKALVANGLVEVVNNDLKFCRLNCKGINPVDFDTNNAYVLIPEWFTSGIYKIERIEKDYIHFIANNLKKSYNNGLIVNDDYNYAKNEIRFRLCNYNTGVNAFGIKSGKVMLPGEMISIHEGKVQRAIIIENCDFKSIEITNLIFCGNSARSGTSLINVINTRGDNTIIHKCSFIGMRSGVILISGSSNLTIKNNIFRDCYYYGINSNNTSNNTSIINNKFYLMGKSVQNSFCILCSGNNFLIKKNELKDFGYGGIAVGLWYGSEQKNPSMGIVENNELYYSSSYISDITNYGLMDGGAIYTFTKNDGTIIRNNYIHDITGAADNRGIFCDDGSYGLRIYGNVITNVYNSYCIDSRRVSSIESKAFDAGGIMANVNVGIYNNVVDGRVRFEANEKENNGCVYGNNYILVGIDKEAPVNIINRVEDSKEDISLDYNDNHPNKVEVSSSSYRVLKKSTVWKGIKKYVTK